MTDSCSALDVRPASRLLKALGDDNRLRMVALLSQGELCVCHIAAALDLGQPNVSQHLTVLKNVGVVASERRGSWIYYRIVTDADLAHARILRAVINSFGDLDAVAADRRRLATTKGTVSCT